MGRLKWPYWLVFGILLLDQLSKIYIKTNFRLNEEVALADWCRIHFIENNGMAFGMELGGSVGKLFLSIFRLIAIGAIGYGLYYCIKKSMHPGFIACVAMVFAGALGNLIDSAFYGLLFSSSDFASVGKFVELGNGYAGFLHGKVVDMLYFPILVGRVPDGMPIWGGEDFVFFSPIFNVADVSISTGMITYLIFQRKFFPENLASHQEGSENPLV